MADRERWTAIKTLMKLGWGSDDSTFRQIFTSRLMPTATRQQADEFNEVGRMASSKTSSPAYRASSRFS